MLLFCFNLQAQPLESIRSFKDHGSCLYGFVNAKGDTVRTAQYPFVSDPENGFYRVFNGVATGLVRQKDGALVLDFAYNGLQPIKEGRRYSRGWFLFEEEGKKGILHLEKGVIQKAAYLYIPDDMRHGAFVAQLNDSDYFLLDTLGHSVDFSGYDRVELSVGKHFVSVRQGDFWALFNQTGGQQTPFRYKGFYARSHQHLFFTTENTSGWMNAQGEIVHEAEEWRSKYYHYRGGNVHHVLYRVSQGGLRSFGLLDTSADLHWTIAPEYDSLAADAERNYVQGFKEGEQYLWSWNSESPLLARAQSIAIPEAGPYAYALRKKRLLRVHLHESRVKRLGKADAYYLSQHENGVMPYWKRGNSWHFLHSNGNLASFEADSIFPLFTECKGRQDTHVVCWQEGRLQLFKPNAQPDSTFAIQDFSFSDLHLVDGKPAHLFVTENKGFMLFDDCGGRVHLAHRRYTQGFDEAGYGLFIFKGANGKSGLLSWEKGLMLAPGYDRIEALSESLMLVTFPNRKGDGLYHVEEGRFLVFPGQYPVFNVDMDKELVRYGYVDSLCIVDFDGNALAEWQQVADVQEYGDGYLLVAVDSFEVGIKSQYGPEQDKWLLPPKYCAIADYRSDLGIASVRACPISPPDIDAWQDGDYGSPTEGNWGLVDSTGAWLIPPYFRYPINVWEEYQVLEKENGKQVLYNLEGTKFWYETYLDISPHVDQKEKYWLTINSNKVGLRTLKGAWEVAPIYDQIIPTPKGYLGLVRAEELADVRLVRFGAQGSTTSIEGLEKMRLLYQYLAASSDEIFMEIPGIERPELQQAFAVWYYEQWWQAGMEGSGFSYDFDGPGDQGFCHPAFRIPEDWQDWVPYERWDEIYVNREATEHTQGLSIEEWTEVCNVGTRGPAYCYTSTSFHNLQLVAGRLQPLEFWEVLDSAKRDVLADTVLARINASGLDLDCAREGNFLEIVQESFLVGADSIQLLLPKPEHEDYVESLDQNYLIISLPLKYWARREW